MVRRPIARAAVAACLAVLITACGSSNTPTVKPGAPSGGPNASGHPATTGGPRASLPVPAGIEQVVYFLVGDSSGTKPTAGTRISLIFEPGGRAVLYLASPTDELGYHGTWEYGSGKLALKFTGSDFSVDASFAVNLADTKVTMPFQVFDVAAGTSTWQRGQLSLVSKVVAVFNAAAADQGATLGPDEALDEAFGLAQAIADSGDPGTDIVATVGSANLADAAGGGSGTGDGSGLLAYALGVARGEVPFSPAADAPAASPPPIKEVTRLDNGVHVEYDGAPAVDVQLFDWAADPASAAKLTKSPIASDPRVRLDSEKPNNAADDPINKRAVFIAPFATGRFYGKKYLLLVPSSIKQWAGADTGEIKPSRGFNWAKDAAKLKDHGYDVDQAMDSDASLARIVQMLGGRSKTPPGLVIFNTHGMGNGTLATGVDLGKVGDAAAVDKAWADAVAAIAPTAPSLLTFDGGTPASPKTLSKMALPVDDAPGVSEYFISLTPTFWKWLAAQGATFDRSLVYIAACSTDSTPDLREAIHARAYLAWTKAVNPLLAGAVANYLVDDMVRATHTAEEVYYNVFRIVSTRQQIYDEDVDMAQAVPGGFDKSVAFLDHFHGYGWNGSDLVPYMTSGWLDRTMNPGNVWWMVFAARWDHHAPDGAAKLVDCQNTYWSKGKPGGLADTFCNSAHPGSDPAPDEVGYATFVLTGKQLLPYSKTVVPRLTLADG